MKDNRFSTPGKPATEFEHDLLRNAEQKGLEDPWVEVAQLVGLDATLRIMDRFERCILSCPQRSTFIARLHRVWLDQESLRLHRARVSNREVAVKLNVTERSVPRRVARALRTAGRRQ